jgi:hypothetical protein
MWTVTILVMDTTQPLTLAFKTKEGADKAVQEIQDNEVAEILDGFGKSLILPGSDCVAAILVEKYEDALATHFEMQRLQIIAQKNFQQKIQNEPGLRGGIQMPGQLPGIIGVKQ